MHNYIDALQEADSAEASGPGFSGCVTGKLVLLCDRRITHGWRRLAHGKWVEPAVTTVRGISGINSLGFM
jgi:hypothetical protein